MRMMCVLELLCSDATAHIKRTGALRGSGAEPHVREEGVPYASPPGIPSPSQRLCLALLLPVPCFFFPLTFTIESPVSSYPSCF